MSRVGDAYIDIQELAIQSLESGAQTVNDVLIYVNRYSKLKVDEPHIVQVIQDLDYDYAGSASQMMEENKNA